MIVALCIFSFIVNTNYSNHCSSITELTKLLFHIASYTRDIHVDIPHVDMPQLRTLGGLNILVKYVWNWYSVIAVYLGLLSQTRAKFRDGEVSIVSRQDFYSFAEKLYRRHCTSCGLRYEQQDDGQIIVSLPIGLKFIIPDEETFQIYSHVLDEIFIMKVYGESHLDDQTVIDIGASAGDSSIYFAWLGAKVYAFEPDPNLFRLLLSNIKLNGFDNRIYAFNEKVSGGSGPGSLENIITTNSLSNIFLKIDCESCEYDIILNTRDFVFEYIKDIVLEFHKKPHIIMKRLSNLGHEVNRKREIICAKNKAALSYPIKRSIFRSA